MQTRIIGLTYEHQRNGGGTCQSGRIANGSGNVVGSKPGEPLQAGTRRDRQRCESRDCRKNQEDADQAAAVGKAEGRGMTFLAIWAAFGTLMAFAVARGISY